MNPKEALSTLLLLFALLGGAVISPTHATWVDPDSPLDVHTTRAWQVSDDRAYHLVFSDESFKSVRLVLSWVCGTLIVCIITDAILLLGSLGLNAAADSPADERSPDA